MKKYYALEVDGVVKVAGPAVDLPKGAVEITKENHDAAKLIRQPLCRKIVNGEVVEKTSEEKELALTEKFGESKKAEAQYRIGRKSYRMVRLPFTFGDKQIKLEEGDLRATPYGAAFVWEHYIRDAVLAELTGNSILPIRVIDVDDNPVVIDNSKSLFDLHAAMLESNKKALESEINLRQELKLKTTFSGVLEVRQLNRERVKE